MATCHLPLSDWISAVDLCHGLLKVRFLVSLSHQPISSLQPQIGGLIKISQMQGSYFSLFRCVGTHCWNLKRQMQ